jgi:hypothetical protein
MFISPDSSAPQLPEAAADLRVTLNYPDCSRGQVER